MEKDYLSRYCFVAGVILAAGNKVPNVNFAVLSFAVCKGDYPVNQGIKSFWCHWSPSFGNEHERGLLLMAKVIRTVKERPGEILGMRDMKAAGRDL
jgi:hypothetical protein